MKSDTDEPFVDPTEPATLKADGKDTTGVDDNEILMSNHAVTHGAITEEDTSSMSSIQPRQTWNPVPIDRGWAWMVLVGCVLQMFLFVGLTKSIGIFFVQFQRKFNSNAATTSLLSTVQSAVYSVSALIVMTAGVKRVSCRTLLMIGATITAIAYIISSRAQTIRLLFFSQGVLQGIGTSFMQPSAIAMVGIYFDKRRGFANSVAVAGGSLGGLVFAPLLTAMFDYYGYSGCLLIIASIYLHGFVSGALFRPQTVYTKTGPSGKHEELLLGEVDDNCTSDIGNTPDNNYVDKYNSIVDDGEHPLVSPSDLSKHVHNMEVSAKNETEISNRIQSLTDEMHGERSKVAIGQRNDKPVIHTLDNMLAESKRRHYSSFEHIGGSMVDIPLQINKPISTSIKKPYQKKQTCLNRCKRILTMVSSTLDFHLFKIPMFVVFQAAAGILCAGSAMGIIYLAPHAADMGTSNTKIAELLTIYGVVDLFSRIAVGYVSDKGFARKSTIIGSSAIIMGVTTHMLRLFTNYKWLVFYAVMMGVFNGVYFSLWASVIVEYLTVARLHSCLGFTTLSHGAFMSASYALLGYVRDASGSYIIPYHLMGGMQFAGACLMFLLPVVEAVYKRRRRPISTDDVS